MWGTVGGEGLAEGGTGSCGTGSGGASRDRLAGMLRLLAGWLSLRVLRFWRVGGGGVGRGLLDRGDGCGLGRVGGRAAERTNVVDIMDG